MWAIMKAYKWRSLTIGGIELAAPADGPQQFIPIFETRDQAVKFADGDETHLAEVEERDVLPSELPPIPHKTGPRLNAISKVRKRYVRKGSLI